MGRYISSMRMRGRLKTAISVLGLFCIIFLVSLYENSKDVNAQPSRKNERRIASIDGQELDRILHETSKKEIIQKPNEIQTIPPKLRTKGNTPKRLLETYAKNSEKFAKRRGGYANRIIVEDVTLPQEWSLSPDLSQKLLSRKEHVQEVCHKYGLDKRTPTHQPNAWEFMINDDYNMAWCPVFKSASSTWMFNFNLLAGFSENFLLGAKETPISLARTKYSRPTVEQLDFALSSNPKPLTFMIVRHPLERLVSGYRDKLQGANRYYKTLAKHIVTEYSYLRKNDPFKQMELETDPLLKARMRARLTRQLVPTFPQFVQFLIDSVKRGDGIDEHWQSMVKFCTPCLVDFDVFAKVETLTEDGNYIIFNSGIEHVISPKRINRSKHAPTNAVAKSYLCQLTKQQMLDLIEIYRYDFELFDYEHESYFNCTGVDTSVATVSMGLIKFHH